MTHAECPDLTPLDPAMPLRILLIEDNEHDRIAFTRALRTCASLCVICPCVRTEEALALLAPVPLAFDIVVVDYNLPGDNGLTLCRTLLERGTPLPIVLLTGSGNEQVAVAALKLGIADYIIKDPNENYLALLPILLPQIVRSYRAVTAQLPPGTGLPTRRARRQSDWRKSSTVFRLPPL